MDASSICATAMLRNRSLIDQVGISTDNGQRLLDEHPNTVAANDMTSQSPNAMTNGLCKQIIEKQDELRDEH